MKNGRKLTDLEKVKLIQNRKKILVKKILMAVFAVFVVLEGYLYYIWVVNEDKMKSIVVYRRPNITKKVEYKNIKLYLPVIGRSGDRDTDTTEVKDYEDTRYYARSDYADKIKLYAKVHNIEEVTEGANKTTEEVTQIVELLLEEYKQMAFHIETDGEVLAETYINKETKLNNVYIDSDGVVYLDFSNKLSKKLLEYQKFAVLRSMSKTVSNYMSTHKDAHKNNISADSISDTAHVNDAETNDVNTAESVAAEDNNTSENVEKSELETYNKIRFLINGNEIQELYLKRLYKIYIKKS